MYDQVQEELMQVGVKIRERRKAVLEDAGSTNNNVRNDALAADAELQDYLDEERALKSSLTILSQRMDLVKADLQLLRSAFYTKF